MVKTGSKKKLFMGAQVIFASRGAEIGKPKRGVNSSPRRQLAGYLASGAEAKDVGTRLGGFEPTTLGSEDRCSVR